MRHPCWQYVFLAAAVLSGFSICAAFACYSGLLLIPTPDVVPSGDYSMELQNDFSTPVRSDNRVSWLNSEYGIMRKLEFGLDLDISPSSDSDVIANAKYVFEVGGRRKVPLAVGSCNMNPRFRSATYLVAGPSFGFGRVSLGVMKNGSTQWFAGIDRALNDKWSIMADYINGRENYWSIGANYALTDHFSILAGAEYPNDPGADVIYSLHCVICGSLSHSSSN